MKKLFPICILLLLTCYLIPENPVDPGSDGYKAPFIVVDTMNFSEGDTIVQDTVSLTFSGNLENRNQYRFRLDSLTWSEWKKFDSSAVLQLKLTRGDSGSHQVHIQTCYDIKGEITDTSFLFFKANTPQISVQPINQQVTVGQQVTFSVTADGFKLQYQWQKDSLILPGDTLPTLTIAKAVKSDSGKLYSCIISNKFNTIYSSKAVLSVTSQVIPPIIAVQPANASVTISQPVEFSVIATGSDLKYQWQKNGIDINGATASKHVIISVAAQDSGTTYKCIVSNAAGTVTSDEALLSVSKTIVKPSIVTQPSSLTLGVGEPATFSVSANGTNLKYLWYRENSALSEATSSTYRISSVSSTDSGVTFYCVVSNSAGEAISSKVILSVIRTNAKPVITSQPANLSLTVGQSATFSVVASGSNLTYQWKKGTTAIPDADSSTYIISSVELTDSGTIFTCDVNNSAGKVTSSSAILSVVSAIIIPVIQVHPLGLTLTEGEPAQFSVSANGANLKYQWQKDTTNIAGETTSNLSIAAVVSADSGHSYRCIVSNSAGSVTSSYALLEVVKSVSLPVITQHPQNISRIEGEAALFSVTATGTNLKFQWQKDTTDIPGENKATYAISAVILTDNGVKFRCKVSNSAGSTISNSASLAVIAAVIPPSIITQPVNKSVITGQGATFAVVASGSDLKFQWQKDTVNIPDATLPEYTITTSQLSDSGATFRCVISNSKGTVISSAAILAVSNNIIPPSIVTQPANQTVIEGQPASFSIVANGTDITYQWQKDTIPITNATSASLQISSAAFADSGSKYRCVVRNSKGSVASSFAVLSVTKQIIPPTIVTQPIDQAVTVGQPAIFSVTATGTSVTYQWQRDSVNIPGANAVSYSIASAAITENGKTFRCVITNTAGTATSRSAVLTVGQNITPVSITQQPQPQIVRLGQTATFTVSATGTNLQFQWQKDSTNIPGQNSASFSIAAVSATDNGSSYRCMVSNSASTVTSTFANLTVAYTLTYYGNGNSTGSAPVDSSKYTLNSIVTVADNAGLLVKTGHTFAGWNRLSNGNGKNYNPGDTLKTGSANMSLFAKWSIDTFTVAFNTNGGSVIASQRILWNQQAVQPSTDPTKDGFGFGGWFANSTLTEAFDFSTPITSARTVYAKWVANYSVSYDGNGNDDGNAPVDNNNYSAGQRVTVLGNMSGLLKTGYSFVCWNTQADTMGTNYSSTDTFSMPTSKVTLYAKWRPKTYTVSFNTGTSTPADPYSKIVTYDNLHGALPSPQRTGYTFGGWWSDVHGNGLEYTPTCRVVRAEDYILYAYWIPETYTITYNINGGDNNPENPENYTIESATIPLKEATKSGYQFDGWCYDTLTRVTITEIKEGSTGDKTLFAKWVPFYHVTYILNGGTNSPTNIDSFTVLTPTFIFESPTRQDYSFNGWYLDSTYITALREISQGTSGAIKVFAKWTWDSTITDIDGNVYHTVKIGNQLWTIENLRTTHYNDGSEIPNITSNSTWANLTTGAYSFCDNSTDPIIQKKWGALYNWYATSATNLAPLGWHIPTDAEWDTLQNYLIVNGFNWDGTLSDNKFAKALASQTDWAPAYSNGQIGKDLYKNNKSGFSALPGGYRHSSGIFYDTYSYGCWWTSSKRDSQYSFNRSLRNTSESMERGTYMLMYGFSIRIVKDND